MKKTRVLLACITAFTLVGSSLAIANDREGAFSVRLGDGYYYFASKRHIDNTSIPNLELGYDFSDHWGARVFAGVLNTKQKNAYGHNNVHGYIYSLNGIYNFTQYGRFEPYILGGLGVTSLKYNNNNDPTNQGNLDLGVGAQYFIDNSISLGADVRDVYTMTGGKNDVMWTAGITFLFGGETQSAASYKGLSSYKK